MAEIARARKRFHDPSPNARPAPTNEAVVASSVWAEGTGQIAPRRSGSQHPKDAVQDTAVICAWHAAWLVRQHWPDDSPLIVGEFIAQAPVWELESRGYDQSQYDLVLLRPGRKSDFWGVRSTGRKNRLGRSKMTQDIHHHQWMHCERGYSITSSARRWIKVDSSTPIALVIHRARALWRRCHTTARRCTLSFLVFSL